MGLLKNIFRKNKTQTETLSQVSSKCKELLVWETFLEELINDGHYISRKDYIQENQ